MEKIELYNQISREIVKNYNTYLHSQDVKILSTLDVPAHYTISHIIDIQLATKLHEISLKLKTLDNSLILNKPENYHITLFWKGMDSQLEEKTDSIKEIIEAASLEFNVEELLFGPLGVSVKFYPRNESFVDARTKLYQLTETPIIIDERFVTTWVSLAAYSQVPQDSVKKFVQENSKINFGVYKNDTLTLYISTNKGLVNPQKVTEFKCRKKTF
jgi:hypothetical protein